MKHRNVILLLLTFFIIFMLVNPGNAIKIKNTITPKNKNIVTADELPDLIVSKVKIKTLYRQREVDNIDYKPYVLEVTVTLKNIGDGYILTYGKDCDIYASISVDGVEKGSISFYDGRYFWAPGVEVTQKKIFTNLIHDNGVHDFMYVADCKEKIKEKNEDNNVFHDDYEIPNKAPYKPCINYNKDKKAYWAATGDPEGDEVRYGWDLDNDDIVDTWSEYTETSEIVYLPSERYDKVKVLAEDIYGAKSEWSDVCNKTVTQDLAKSLLETLSVASQKFKKMKQLLVNHLLLYKNKSQGVKTLDEEQYIFEDVYVSIVGRCKSIATTDNAWDGGWYNGSLQGAGAIVYGTPGEYTSGL